MLANLTELGGVLVKLGLFVLVLGAALRMTVIDIYDVEHNGMAPTLLMGDKVAVLTIGTIDFADVVLCENPSEDGELMLGRVVAMEGSTLNHRDRDLLVDGDAADTVSQALVAFYDEERERHRRMQTVQESFAGNHVHSIFMEAGEHMSLRETFVNHGVFLLGDNRTDTGHDSRTDGTVDPRDCIGQVIVRLKPAPDRDDEVKGGYLDIIE